MDICRATARSKGKTLICQLPLNHGGDHDDGLGQTWEPVQAWTGELGSSRVFNL